jgi:hypothetical protein
MVNRSSVSGKKPSAPMSVPSPGATPKMGIQPPKVGTGLGGNRARIKPVGPGMGNTRDYGKAPPAAPAPQPSPFGPSTGNSRLGGI